MPNLQEKKRELIVDYGLKIIRLWLENPDETLSWVLIELDKRYETEQNTLKKAQEDAKGKGPKRVRTKH